MLALAGLLLIFNLYDKWRSQRKLVLPIFLAVACIGLFSVQTLHSNRGHRWHIPYLNILSDRILTDENKTAYFTERDMPQNDKVMQYAGKRAWAYQPEHDLRHEINDWLNIQGRQVYAEYLLTYPADSVSAPIQNWQQLLAYHYSLAFLGSMESDSDAPAWLNTYSCAVYWDDIATCGIIRNPNLQHQFSAFFPLVMTISATVLGLMSCFTYGWDRRQIYPIFMLFFMYVLGFVTWHGDADSIERHAVQVNILWRLSLWFAIFFACDFMLSHTTLLKKEILQTRTYPRF